MSTVVHHWVRTYRKRTKFLIADCDQSWSIKFVNHWMNCWGITRFTSNWRIRRATSSWRIGSTFKSLLATLLLKECLIDRLNNHLRHKWNICVMGRGRTGAGAGGGTENGRIQIGPRALVCSCLPRCSVMRKRRHDVCSCWRGAWAYGHTLLKININYAFSFCPKKLSPLEIMEE